jgi:hypothetical protein
MAAGVGSNGGEFEQGGERASIVPMIHGPVESRSDSAFLTLEMGSRVDVGMAHYVHDHRFEFGR